MQGTLPRTVSRAGCPASSNLRQEGEVEGKRERMGIGRSPFVNCLKISKPLVSLEMPCSSLTSTLLPQGGILALSLQTPNQPL